MFVTIYRTHTESLIIQELLPMLLQWLPTSLHAKALRYRSKASAYNYVAGRLLLKQGLDAYGLDDDLRKIELQENGKPVLPEIHFNISHSGHQVVCGFSKEGLLGVDIEKISPIDFEDFTAMFSAHEWSAIKGAVDPLREFYWFWTRKESIIKALGLRLNYLHKVELDVSSDHFVLEGKRWFLRDLTFGKDFLGAVCCEDEISEIEFIDVRF
ncbi:MAG: 4'-phosphopantetheinyl transferase superfamily protein [Saprospiraceae bacterium]